MLWVYPLTLSNLTNFQYLTCMIWKLNRINGTNIKPQYLSKEMKYMRERETTILVHDKRKHEWLSLINLSLSVNRIIFCSWKPSVFVGVLRTIENKKAHLSVRLYNLSICNLKFILKGDKVLKLTESFCHLDLFLNTTEKSIYEYIQI